MYPLQDERPYRFSRKKYSAEHFASIVRVDVMAGDWIKLEIATPDKPEVYQLANLLNLELDAVLGKLIRVWVWFDTQSTNCHAPSVTKNIIDHDTRVTGFAQAMIDVGWLCEEDEGIYLPNGDRHNGKSAKSRALAYKRKQKERSRSSHADSVTRGRERERERGKEKSVKKETSPFTPPPTINSKAWADLDQYRSTHNAKKVRDTWTNLAKAKACNLLEPLNHEDQQRCVDQTIANGWQGIFPDKIGSTSNGTQSHQPTNAQRRHKLHHETYEQMYNEAAAAESEMDFSDL
ncbi:MAG: hypothetical protein JAY74_25360 [Candidatus Thiodiazotropha taylori]|nr:hypothetical protein [Candidatus Thiodiazotropha taylori]